MTSKIAVIGAGPGGYVAAVRAAQLGARVTLIDKQPVGGTCLHWGCIPSKIMKTSADMLHHFKQAADFGIDVDGRAEVNMPSLMARKERIVQTQVRGIEALLKHHKVELVYGRARIAGHGRLDVDKTDGSRAQVAWERLILATGSLPNVPKIPGDEKKNIFPIYLLIAITE